MEGRPTIDTGRICARLALLADQERKPKSDHRIFRIKVVSAEGTNETINILVDTGHKRQPEAFLEKIADQLMVNRDELEEVIDHWTKDDLLKRCAELSSDELKPPAMRIGAPGAAPPRKRVKQAKPKR